MLAIQFLYCKLVNAVVIHLVIARNVTGVAQYLFNVALLYRVVRFFKVMPKYTGYRLEEEGVKTTFKFFGQGKASVTRFAANQFYKHLTLTNCQIFNLLIKQRFNVTFAGLHQFLLFLFIAG